MLKVCFPTSRFELEVACLLALRPRSKVNLATPKIWTTSGFTHFKPSRKSHRGAFCFWVLGWFLVAWLLGVLLLLLLLLFYFLRQVLLYSPRYLGNCKE